MILPPLLFPPIRWFQLQQSISLNGSYVKQSLMNRFWLKAPGQPMLMIVPVVHIGRTRTLSETEIAYKDNWPIRMERSIESCYRKSAFFEHYFPEVQAILNQRFEKLTDLSLASTTLLSKGFGLGLLNVSGVEPFDFPENIFPPRPFPQDLSELPRFQLFGEFVPGLSGLDALFNYGPETRQWIRR